MTDEVFKTSLVLGLALDIGVETICLMKKADDGYWHIDSEIKLGQ